MSFISLASLHYIHFDLIDSTNSWAKQNALLLDPLGVTCITASEQTKGRGTWGKQWISPNQENIYASLFFLLSRTCPYLHNMGQLFSLSLLELLKDYGFAPQIKWPNDLFLQEKKCGGVLIETTQVANPEKMGVILGFGLNVNMSKEGLDAINPIATSLSDISGKKWNEQEILQGVISRFLPDLDLLLEEGFGIFVERYASHLMGLGKQQLCRIDGRKVPAMWQKILPDGRLSVVLESGEEREVAAYSDV